VKTGVMHLIAVSGLNVAYVIIIITTILGIFRVYFKKRAIIAIAALIFYCIFTGSSPSIVRATIMGILLLIAYESELKTNFYNIVGFSAIVILIFNTKQLFDPGFILSYTAVLSMVFCYERFKPFLVDRLDKYEWRYKKYLKYLVILIVTTLAAQIGVLPVSGNYFEKISIISILTNLIVVPLANISLAIGFMQIITAIFSEYLAGIIASANMAILSFQLWFIKLCASLKYSYFDVYKFDLFNIILYFLGLILIITMNRKNWRFRLAIVLLIIPAVFLHNTELEKKFRVNFLDTGDGQCTVIETSEGQTILIDCGTKTDTYDSGERTIVPFLKRSGIEVIDLIILTGDQKDKTGGLEYLLENFPVHQIIKSKDSFLGYREERVINSKDINVTIASDGDYIDDFENIRLYFMEVMDSQKHNLSTKLVYKNLDILFLSNDIKRNTNTSIRDNYSEFIKSDILRLGRSLSPSIIEKISPEMVVTTEKSINEYPAFIQPVRQFSTNQSRALIIESDGNNIQIIK
jgi:competence protein ComEC